MLGKKANPHRRRSMRVQNRAGNAGKVKLVSHNSLQFVKKHLATVALMLHIQFIAALGWPSWGWASRLADKLLVVSEGVES
jgi:CelD/BcsL family acetyltransferase involved in cellulose biosynthesis